MKKIDIPKERVLIASRLHKRGLFNSQIADIMNMTKEGIRKMLKRANKGE